VASRVTITGNMREVSKKYLAQANRGPVQMGFLMGSAVSSAAEQIAKNAIYASPNAVPSVDAYKSRKGRREIKTYSKTKIVARSNEVLRSMRTTWWSAAKEAPAYSLQTQNMSLKVTRGANDTTCSWRSADGGKMASLENKGWIGRQEIGNRIQFWPIISGRPRRFVNKRWSAMLRVIRKTFDEYISLQANMTGKMPSRPVVPRG
jgi:hypothetical protein